MQVSQLDTNNYYAGSTDDYGGPMPHGCVKATPPKFPWVKTWYRWDGKKFQKVADHRARRVQEGFAPELVQLATDYWLADDVYGSPARHMTEIGPLPENAITTAPEKPLAMAQAEKLREISAAHERALAGSVALSDPTPSTVAVESSLLAVSDAEGLEYVRDQLAARRATLEANVHAAATVAQLAAISVSFDV